MTAALMKIAQALGLSRPERAYPPVTREQIEATKAQVKPVFDSGRWVTDK